MESLYLLIPLSVAIVFFALWVFFKAMDDYAVQNNIKKGENGMWRELFWWEGQYFADYLTTGVRRKLKRGERKYN